MSAALDDYRPQPVATIESVTSQVARSWLQANENNRPMNWSTVKRYENDMLDGAWSMTGEAVKFSLSGRLLDGQHRLTALARLPEGIAVDLLVVRGLADRAQLNMDTGDKRTVGQALKIQGVANASLVGSVAKIAINVDAGTLAAAARAQTVTHAQVDTFLGEHPDLLDAVREIATIAGRTRCPSLGMVAYTYLRFRRIHPGQALQFWRDVADGVNLGAGDPALTLKNRFVDARTRRERLTLPLQLSMICRAWNARREGRTLQVIRVNNSRGEFVPAPEPK